MSDDLNKKIKQLTDMLGQDNMPDNIKGLLSLLTSSSPKEDASPRVPEPEPVKEEKAAKNDLDDSMEMMRKVKKMIDAANVNTDPRINLLNAIRPFLSSSRQKKVGSCIKLLQMSRLTRFMDDSDKSNG